MKKIMLLSVLLMLTGCDGSTAHGFWGPSAPTGTWDKESMRACELYNSCNDGCELYGNCGGGSDSKDSGNVWGTGTQ
jgi:hypothetical protein